jgi:hypothetical protein
MDTSLAVAYLDLFTAPVLIAYVLFSCTARKYPFTIRFGMFTASFGMLAQSYVVFAGMNQLQGLGTLWALKDIGLSIIAASIAVKCLFWAIRHLVKGNR